MCAKMTLIYTRYHQALHGANEISRVAAAMREMRCYLHIAQPEEEMTIMNANLQQIWCNVDDRNKYHTFCNQVIKIN